MYGAWNLRARKLSRQATLALVVVFGYFCIFAVTKIDLTQQVQNILPWANGGTGQSTFSAGVVRSSGSALSSAELSGDATTSSSNVVTVAKVNGTSVPTNAAADQVVVTTSAATGAWASIPNCTAGALQYATATHAFSCGTVLTGTFVDSEVPGGAINGTNAAFTLAHAPSPAASLQLYKNGQEMIAGGSDYTLSSLTITYVSGAIPKTGDVHVASYRY